MRDGLFLATLTMLAPAGCGKRSDEADSPAPASNPRPQATLIHR